MGDHHRTTPDERADSAAKDATREAKTDRWRVWISTLSITVGAVLSFVALSVAIIALNENADDILDQCLASNRNRPQIALNQLVSQDGALKALDVPLDVRRVVAQGALDSLERETARDGSAGPRDCNKDGHVDARDYPPGDLPPPFLDARTGLPTGARP